jgi:hypothetical protein
VQPAEPLLQLVLRLELSVAGAPLEAVWAAGGASVMSPLVAIVAQAASVVLLRPTATVDSSAGNITAARVWLTTCSDVSSGVSYAVASDHTVNELGITSRPSLAALRRLPQLPMFARPDVVAHTVQAEKEAEAAVHQALGCSVPRLLAGCSIPAVGFSATMRIAINATAPIDAPAVMSHLLAYLQRDAGAAALTAAAAGIVAVAAATPPQQGPILWPNGANTTAAAALCVFNFTVGALTSLGAATPLPLPLGITPGSAAGTVAEAPSNAATAGIAGAVVAVALLTAGAVFVLLRRRNRRRQRPVAGLYFTTRVTTGTASSLGRSRKGAHGLGSNVNRSPGTPKPLSQLPSGTAPQLQSSLGVYNRSGHLPIGVRKPAVGARRTAGAPGLSGGYGPEAGIDASAELEFSCNPLLARREPTAGDVTGGKTATGLSGGVAGAVTFSAGAAGKGSAAFTVGDFSGAKRLRAAGLQTQGAQRVRTLPQVASESSTDASDSECPARATPVLTRPTSALRPRTKREMQAMLTRDLDDVCAVAMPSAVGARAPRLSLRNLRNELAPTAVAATAANSAAATPSDVCRLPILHGALGTAISPPDSAAARAAAARRHVKLGAGAGKGGPTRAAGDSGPRDLRAYRATSVRTLRAELGGTSTNGGAPDGETEP